MKDFFLDFETRSRQDLKKVGAAKYALCSSTEATLLTWAVDDNKVQAWRMGQPMPQEIMYIAEHPEEYRFIAHNAEFDYLIWTCAFMTRIGVYAPKQPPIANVSCTKGMSQRFGAS
ncbi:unnamed protein product, partial [marine sediment metagenome]